MPVVQLSKTGKIARSLLQHYDEQKYWKMKKYVENYSGGGYSARSKHCFIYIESKRQMLLIMHL